MPKFGMVFWRSVLPAGAIDVGVNEPGGIVGTFWLEQGLSVCERWSTGGLEQQEGAVVSVSWPHPSSRPASCPLSMLNAHFWL